MKLSTARVGLEDWPDRHCDRSMADIDIARLCFAPPALGKQFFDAAFRKRSGMALLQA